MAQKHDYELRTRSQRAHACPQSLLKCQVDRGSQSHLICWRTLPHLLRILKTIPFCVIRELSFFAMQLCVCVCVCVCSVTQSCLTICDHTDCSPPGSSVHGISHAKILERIANYYSKGSSNPGIELLSPVSPALAGGCFKVMAP